MNLALIDGMAHEYDSEGYVYAHDLNGRVCRASYHPSIIEAHNRGENTKVITSGHVYVAKYNPETYVETRPRTFEEYLEMHRDGEELFQKVES